MKWYWLVCGIFMILLEFGIPGFVICFFGVSAVITGGLCFLFDIPLIWQLLIFSLGGTLLALLCRWIAPGVFRGKVDYGQKDVDDDDVSGMHCQCVEKISRMSAGKVEFRGSLWNAESDQEIPAGDLCTVIKRENLTLHVRKHDVGEK